MRNPVTIGVAGAGSIGAYLGGRLAAAGHRVVLLGRQRLADAVADKGLRLTALDGFDQTVGADALEITTDPAALAGCDLVLVTTKSHDTEPMARSLAPHLNNGITVVSFQNGVRNPAVLRERLPGMHVLAGMVPYNVIWTDAAHFHQGTSGSLVVETGEPLDHVARAVGQVGVAIEQGSRCRWQLPTLQHDGLGHGNPTLRASGGARCSGVPPPSR